MLLFLLDVLLHLCCTNWPLSHTFKHSATYDVQNVELHVGRGNISIQCVFASGSQARGCFVKIRNSSIDKITSSSVNITRSGSSQSQVAEQTVTQLTPGSYEVLIFDWERDGSLASTPSYVGNVTITADPSNPSSVSPTTITGYTKMSQIHRVLHCMCVTSKCLSHCAIVLLFVVEGLCVWHWIRSMIFSAALAKKKNYTCWRFSKWLKA